MSAHDYQELYQLRTIKDQLEVVVNDLKLKGLSLTIDTEGRLALDQVTRQLTDILDWGAPSLFGEHRQARGNVSVSTG